MDDMLVARMPGLDEMSLEDLLEDEDLLAALRLALTDTPLPAKAPRRWMKFGSSL